MFTLEFQVAGEVQLHRSIDRFVGAVTNFEPLWPELRDVFYAIEAEQFKTEGGAGASGRWQELSPTYAAYKAKRYGQRGILDAVGVLMDSLTHEGGYGVYHAGRDQLEIGSSVRYGVFHQKGTRNMPARRVIDLSERNEKRMMRTVQAYLVRATRG